MIGLLGCTFIKWRRGILVTTFRRYDIRQARIGLYWDADKDKDLTARLDFHENSQPWPPIQKHSNRS